MEMNGIAVIGAGMIGAAHASGYRLQLPRFASQIDGIHLATICDSDRDLAERMAATYGFGGVSDDWTSVMADPSIAVVSIALPNFLHVEVVMAALQQGKHVLCEKPLALNAKDARRLYEASKSAGVTAATVFNYRRFPAVAESRQRIRDGDIGDPVHIQVQYQSEYAADPDLPHSWRYERSRAGAGALLDVGTHAVDAARFLCGEVSEVSGAVAAISVKQRFVAKGATLGHDRVEMSNEKRPVDNDDVASALLQFENGAQGIVLASRVAVGQGNTLSFTISGTRGTIRFTSEIPGRFEIARFDGSGHSPFVVVATRPASPYAAALLPVPHDGVAVGYGEAFGFMIHEFLSAVAQNRQIESGSLLDGVRAAQILDAIQTAIDRRRPVTVVPAT